MSKFIAMHLFVTMLCSHEPISLRCMKMLAVYSKSPNGEYAAVVRVIEDNSAVDSCSFQRVPVS